MEESAGILERITEQSILAGVLFFFLVALAVYHHRDRNSLIETIKEKDLEIKKLNESRDELRKEQTELLSKVNAFLDTYLIKSESLSQTALSEIRALATTIKQELLTHLSKSEKTIEEFRKILKP